MRKFLAEIAFEMDEHYLLNLCDHDSYIQTLLDKAIVSTYVLSNDSARMWIILKEEDRFKAEQHLTKSPLYSSLNIHIEEIQDLKQHFLYKTNTIDPDLQLAKQNQN